MADVSLSLADGVKTFHGADQFTRRKQFDFETTARSQGHRIGKMLGHIIEEQTLRPGHNHLPFEFFLGGFDRAQFFFDFLVAFVGTKLFALGGERVRGQDQAESNQQTDQQVKLLHELSSFSGCDNGQNFLCPAYG